MAILTDHTPHALWSRVVRVAASDCNIRIEQQLETYLVELLHRLSDRPEILDRVMALDFMDAMQFERLQKMHRLQQVGDHCLIFSGLFPKIAEKRRVNLSYFVDIGRSAYDSASGNVDDVFKRLSQRFVALMDVLQSIRSNSELTPLEAYEQWHELGSVRAKNTLNRLRR